MATISNLGGNYALGSTNPPTALEHQGITDPVGEFTPYAEVIANAGQWRTLHLGKPVAKWRFGMINQVELNSLLAYIASGPTGVYIKTRIHTGITPAYVTFSAIMHYPTELKPRPGGLWEDVEFVFTDLVNA